MGGCGEKRDEQAVGENFFAGASASVVVGGYDHHPEKVLYDVFYLRCIGVSRRILKPRRQRGLLTFHVGVDIALYRRHASWVGCCASFETFCISSRSQRA